MPASLAAGRVAGGDGEAGVRAARWADPGLRRGGQPKRMCGSAEGPLRLEIGCTGDRDTPQPVPDELLEAQLLMLVHLTVPIRSFVRPGGPARPCRASAGLTRC